MSSDELAIKGGAFTSKLYFDPRADEPEDKGFRSTFSNIKPAEIKTFVRFFLPYDDFQLLD